MLLAGSFIYVWFIPLMVLAEKKAEGGDQSTMIFIGIGVAILVVVLILVAGRKKKREGEKGAGAA